ncbi:MAG: PDZ domain-containing protein [Planctomycetaceae bacterium]|nr:PDZ domain-containing protein [Planctomycetaceae bacterium]
MWIISFALSSALCSTPGVSAANGSDVRLTPLVRAIRRAEAGVVNIHTERSSRDRERDPSFEGTSGRKVTGMGSGIIIDERGYIVTNEHVIADTTLRRVTLNDGSTYSAEIIAASRKYDLAIIKIEPSRPMLIIPIGISSDIMKGETVVAVGNPYGYEDSVSEGIISALLRNVEVNDHQSYKNLLQTDASINPGNSGGPLVNLDGEVIGINVAIRAGAQRIGFAIPIDDARKYIASLLDIRIHNETYHGLLAHDVKTPAHRKLVVDAAEPNSPAATAGFLPGDVVSQVGTLRIVDRADLERAFLGKPAREPVDVLVQRKDETVKLTIQLAKVDAPQIAAASKASQTVQKPRSVRDDVAAGKSWTVLGLRLDKTDRSNLGAKYRSQYRGGMKVVDVRPGSPAAQDGIRKGDILVGLGKYETIKHEDIVWVLDQAKTSTSQDALEFYVVREQKMWVGNLRPATVVK